MGRGVEDMGMCLLKNMYTANLNELIHYTGHENILHVDQYTHIIKL